MLITPQHFLEYQSISFPSPSPSILHPVGLFPLECIWLAKLVKMAKVVSE